MDFCRQALHGLQFLQEKNIAHRSFIRPVGHLCLLIHLPRDPHSMNIMLDPEDMYPDGFFTGRSYLNHRTPDLSARAKGFTRMQCSPRYYWIDYGLSSVYEHPERPGTLRVLYARGGDRDIPETQKRQQYADPFATDVWWAGNLIRTRLVEVPLDPLSISPLF